MQRVLSFRQLQLYSFAVCTFSSWQVSASGLCISLQAQLQGIELGLVPAHFDNKIDVCKHLILCLIYAAVSS